MIYCFHIEETGAEVEQISNPTETSDNFLKDKFKGFPELAATVISLGTSLAAIPTLLSGHFYEGTTLFFGGQSISLAIKGLMSEPKK